MQEAPRTLREVRNSVLRKLGQSSDTLPAADRVWSDDEVDGWLLEAARDFGIKTKLVWDMAYLDDLPFTGNYNEKWERAFVLTGAARLGQFEFTQDFERDYINRQPDSLSPANHTNLLERDGYLDEDLIAAVSQLPEDLLQIDRVTWDGRRILPFTTRYLRRQDNYFETVRGDVLGYLQDRDGLRSLRKWKVPRTKATYYLVSGEFGVLRASAADIATATGTLRIHIDQFGMVFSGALDSGPSVFGPFSSGTGPGGVSLVTDSLDTLAEFSEYEVVSRDGFGILKRIPNYFPSAGPWGFVRRLSLDTKNTRVEHYRRPQVPADDNDIFEIPNYMLRYLEHYARCKAYSKRGIGQNIKLAKHYNARYEAGITRTMSRVNAINSARIVRMGGQDQEFFKRAPYPLRPRNIPEE